MDADPNQPVSYPGERARVTPPVYLLYKSTMYNTFENVARIDGGMDMLSANATIRNSPPPWLANTYIFFFCC